MAFGFRVVAAAAFFCFSVSTVSADEAVSIKVGYQMLSPSGELAAEVNGIGTRVNLENDLDLGDSEDLMAEVAVAFGDIKLTAGYLPLSFEGDSLLTRTIIFDGQAYPLGAPVSSSLDLDILDVGLTWYFINLDDTPTRFQLGVEVAAKVIDAEASIASEPLGISDSDSATVPLPTVGVRARVAFADFVGINGRFGYLGYNDNHFMDADVQLEISPLPLVGIFAGYRYLDLEIDESDVFVDADFSGFYGGAFVRF